MKRTYGEEIVERLRNLDFTLPLEKMMGKVYSRLPEKMSKEEAVKYYNRKLKKHWENVA